MKKSTHPTKVLDHQHIFHGTGEQIPSILPYQCSIHAPTCKLDRTFRVGQVGASSSCWGTLEVPNFRTLKSTDPLLAHLHCHKMAEFQSAVLLQVGIRGHRLFWCYILLKNIMRIWTYCNSNSLHHMKSGPFFLSTFQRRDQFWNYSSKLVADCVDQLSNPQKSWSDTFRKQEGIESHICGIFTMACGDFHPTDTQW